MTTEERDQIVGRLMREKRDAERTLACLMAKRDSIVDTLTMAQTQLHNLVIGSLAMPTSDQLTELVKEIHDTSDVIEKRAARIEEILG